VRSEDVMVMITVLVFGLCAVMLGTAYRASSDAGAIHAQDVARINDLEAEKVGLVAECQAGRGAEATASVVLPADVLAAIDYRASQVACAETTVIYWRDDFAEALASAELHLEVAALWLGLAETDIRLFADHLEGR